MTTSSEAAIEKWVVKEPYLTLRCALGEGPYYESTTHSLRFVDIKKNQIHSVDLNAGPGSLKTLQLDIPVGVTANIEGVDPKKKILIGGKSGLYVLDRDTGKYELLKKFYDNSEIKDKRMRGNDGAVDPAGRFWIGTMNDFWVGPAQPEGSLFRFNTDLSRAELITSILIPNSVGWSPDHKTLYFVNSTEQKIIAFDYNVEDGGITNERILYKHDGSGDPDGFKIDENGFIWQAFYGESYVLKISPEGKVVGRVEYPTRAITCPCFIGTELWVTTADEDDESKVESKKFGGNVFKVDVGVRGLKDFEFKLQKPL